MEKISEKDFKEPLHIKPKKSHAPKAHPRTNIVPRNCKLKIGNAKIEKIYDELRGLQLSRHVHAIGVLFRVFLEMSVDEYLTKAGIPLTFTAKGGHTADKKLAAKVSEAIDHMTSNGANKRDFKGVLTGLNDHHHPFSIDTLHAYIHSRFFSPTAEHLEIGWDNAQRFFETIWA